MKKNEKTYMAGIYARLSVEGSGRKNESIETQIAIAKEFIEKQTDIILYRCYTDLGKTGTNFKREGFELMMQDVRLHRINCIIVKDLSRFGRNHIETGNYIEKIFPFLGVRFIAVADSVDSMHMSGENNVFGVNLKNLVNEMYAKDISAKVKAGKRQKRAQGNYVGGIPAYGYRIGWENEKRILLPEEGTSDIVKKIFELFLSGNNWGQISAWLYGKRIIRPKDYRKTGHIYAQGGESVLQWPKDTIKSILKNPVYIGILLGEEQDAQAWDRQRIEKELGEGKKYTHEPLVDEEIFFSVSEKLKKQRNCYAKKSEGNEGRKKEDIFAGILVCGDCGAKLQKTVYTKNNTWSYHCASSGYLDGRRCRKKSISFRKLCAILKTVLLQEILLAGVTEESLVAADKHESANQKNDRKEQCKNIERKIENIKKQSSEQYAKYCFGELSLQMFQERKTEFEKKRLDLQEQKHKLSYVMEREGQWETKKQSLLHGLCKGEENIIFTQDILSIFVKKIELYPDKRIRIIFYFRRRGIKARYF